MAETLEEVSRAREVGRLRPFTLRLTTDKTTALDGIARRFGMSRKAVIEFACDRLIDEHSGQATPAGTDAD